MFYRMTVAALASILMAAPAFGQGKPNQGSDPPSGTSAPTTPIPAPSAPGTIKPPSVDPGIRAKMPPSATMTKGSVIRPPGSPGGDPNVVPK